MHRLYEAFDALYDKLEEQGVTETIDYFELFIDPLVNTCELYSPEFFYLHGDPMAYDYDKYITYLNNLLDENPFKEFWKGRKIVFDVIGPLVFDMETDGKRVETYKEFLIRTGQVKKNG